MLLLINNQIIDVIGIGALLTLLKLPLWYKSSIPRFIGDHLGKMIPPERVDKYLLRVVLRIILLSFVPSIINII